MWLVTIHLYTHANNDPHLKSFSGSYNFLSLLDYTIFKGVLGKKKKKKIEMCNNVIFLSVLKHNVRFWCVCIEFAFKDDNCDNFNLDDLTWA